MEPLIPNDPGGIRAEVEVCVNWQVAQFAQFPHTPNLG